VACQKGLRSLAAAEQLSRAGYSKLAWINGGFDTARPGDLPTTDDKDVRCVTVITGITMHSVGFAVICMVVLLQFVE
jgi:hypothetical protein